MKFLPRAVGERSIILLKDSRDKMEKRETGYFGLQSPV